MLGELDRVGAVLRDDVRVRGQAIAATGAAQHDAAGGDVDAAVHIELAGPELHNAAEAVGLQRLRGGKIDRVLNVLGVVAGNGVDVNCDRNVFRDVRLPAP